MKNAIHFACLTLFMLPTLLLSQTPIRINSGGGQITYQGDVFSADQYGSGSNTGSRGSLAEPYRSERFGGGGTFNYDIPVSSGTYTVNLHFAEIWFGAPGGGSGGTGSRVFDVDIEGTTVLSQFDIYATSGSNPNVQQFTVTVTDGNLDIFFTSGRAGGANNPKVSGIEVIPGSTTSVTGVSVSPNSLSLAVGNSGNLTATVSPSNASNQAVTWSSSDTSVASVNSSGTVTANAVGSATITATTVDGSFTATSTITVSSGNPPSGNSPWSQTGSTVFLGNSTDKVAIGRSTVPSGYTLAVDGPVRAREVRVDLDTWPDYVFQNNYNLPTLAEIKDFIDKNGHLPNIPSAEKVQNEGVALGDMNRLLLEKIEELTLYTLQQQELIENLQEEIAVMKKQSVQE
ncbi:MAG: malectin domain-containing carbohydrate-binding protein [Bacteroidota bacterium]